MDVKRFDVFLVNLNPSKGHEIQKIRPCLVISPDEMNQHISTVIIALMTTKGRNYPTRIACVFQGKKGQIVLDQIRTVDKGRLVKKCGTVSITAQKTVLSILKELESTEFYGTIN